MSGEATGNETYRVWTDDEIDREWSSGIAGLIASDLIDAKLIAADQADRAQEIIAFKLHIRLMLDDRPARSNRH